jgi:hypothetical protein
VLSLVLQAAGGALAATSNAANGGGNTGLNVMIAGLVFQVVSLLLFAGLAVDFAVSVWRGARSYAALRRSNMPGQASGPAYPYLASARKVSPKRIKMFSGALAVATLAVFVRCVFRVAELKEGFNGHLANDEVTFMILEGPMIMVAGVALTVFHPGWVLGGAWQMGKVAKAGKEEIPLV